MNELEKISAIGGRDPASLFGSGDRAALLRDALDQVHYGVVVTTAGSALDEVKVSYVNHGFTAVTGYSASEVIGSALTLLHGPKSDPDVIDRMTKAMADGKHFETSLTSYGKSGKELILDWRLSPMYGDVSQVIHWVCTLLDVTDRVAEQLTLRDSLQQLVDRAEGRTLELAKINIRLNREIADRENAEAAQREIQSRYDSAIKAGNVGLWEWDILSDDLFIDPHLKAMLGYEDNEISNHMQAWLEHVHPEDRDMVRAEYAAHLEGRTGEFLSEHRMLHKDGSVRWFFARGNAVRNENGIANRMSGSHNEITLRKRFEQELHKAKEEAESANRAKSSFLASVSHELRTPLNAILGFSEIIKDETFGPVGLKRYTEYARDIHDSGNHLLSLINDILDISKIEAGKFQLSKESFDLGALIQECLRLVQVRADKGDISLRYKPQELPDILADKRAVKQALINLLTNAVKFTEPGGWVAAEVRADGDCFIIAVEDNGIGIAKSDIAKLGKVFTQIANPTRRNRDGTGLGLAITKSIIELHGGSFAIDSEMGKGTRVTFTLPRG